MSTRKHRPKLLAILPNLGRGGAERVMSWLCSRLADSRDWEVNLLVLGGSRDLEAYPLSSRIRLIEAGLEGSGWELRKMGNLGRRVLFIQKTVRQTRPDAVLSFLDSNNLVVLLATLLSRVRVVVSERIDPARQPFPRPARLGRRVLYRRANALVVQTERVRGFFEDHKIRNLCVIPNALEEEFFAGEINVSAKRVLAVGRLSPQKGITLLIRAYARIQADCPDWELVVYGEGEERESLEALIRKENLEGKVSLPGATPDVARTLREGAVFAFPSLFEGFPNALAEAMAGGLPVVAFKDVSGVEDLVIHGETGFLAAHQDERELASCLRQLMESEPLRQKIGEAGKAWVRERCQPERILEAWEAVLLGKATTESAMAP